MFDMLKKVKEMKGKTKEIKERLDGMTFVSTSEDGKITVECSGGRRITKIDVDSGVYNVREQSVVIDEILKLANQALSQAEDTGKAELKSVMPNIPGLNLDF